MFISQRIWISLRTWVRFTNRVNFTLSNAQVSLNFACIVKFYGLNFMMKFWLLIKEWFELFMIEGFWSSEFIDNPSYKFPVFSNICLYKLFTKYYTLYSYRCFEWQWSHAVRLCNAFSSRGHIGVDHSSIYHFTLYTL